jgi:DNA primase
VSEEYQAPKSQVQQVRQATDIVDIISEYVPLKKAGLNFKGLCPFHQEKTPSFMVSRSKQIYHCFGCGLGGNSFDFLMKIQNIGFREALERLAAKAGIELRGYSGKRADAGEERFFELNRIAMEFYNGILMDPKLGAHPLKYLTGRGVGKKEVSDFKLGWAPPSWEALTRFLNGKGRNLSEASKAGLVVEKKRRGEYYDRFRGRIIFPIFDMERRVIGFGGRMLSGDGAKYLNSPETPLFSKSSSFYGIDSASGAIRKEKSVIVVEGYMDLLALRRFNFDNSVATLGTAFTMDHGRILKRFTDNVYITFDSDEAGLMAVKRTLRPTLLNSLNAKIILLPPPHDPDTFLNREGSAKFRLLIEKAEDLLDFYIKRYFKQEVTRVGQARVLDEMREILQEIPNQFERELAIKRAAELTGFKEVLFKQREKKSVARDISASNPGRFPREEIHLIRLMAEENGVAEKVKENAILDSFSSQELKKFANMLLSAKTESNGNSLAQILSEIDDRDARRALTEALVQESGLSRHDAMKEFNDCVERMREKRNIDMAKGIKEAELSGNEAKLKELLRKKIEERRNLRKNKSLRH